MLDKRCSQESCFRYRKIRTDITKVTKSKRGYILNHLLKKIYLFIVLVMSLETQASPIQIECAVKEAIYEGEVVSVLDNKITVLFEMYYLTNPLSTSDGESSSIHHLSVYSGFKIVDSKSKEQEYSFGVFHHGNRNQKHETDTPWDRIDYVHKMSQRKTKDFTTWLERFFYLNRVSGEIAFGYLEMGQFDGKEPSMRFPRLEIKGVCEKSATPRLKF